MGLKIALGLVGLSVPRLVSQAAIRTTRGPTQTYLGSPCNQSMEQIRTFTGKLQFFLWTTQQLFA